MSITVIENGKNHEVLNPRGMKPQPTLYSSAARLSDLKGKVVYCISQHVFGSDAFIEKIARELPRYAPGVRAEYRRKPLAYGVDDPEFWEEVRKEGDAFIYGCGA